MRRWLGLAVELLIALGFALLVVEIAVGIAHGETVPAGVRWAGDQTCTPGSVKYVGALAIYDNAWLEPRQCVSTNGTDAITITSPAVPLGGTVVAYPSVRFGAFYTFADAASGLPLPVTELGELTAHVASLGRAGGAWQSDIDAWFHPSAGSIAHHHGTEELVISNRYAWRIGGKGDAIARIGGRAYRWATWLTCQRTSTGGCDRSIKPWRIAVFWRVHPGARARIRLGAFAAFLIARGDLPRRDVLSSVAYGTELWSGGKGLTDTLRMTGLPPRLHPPGSR